MTVREAEVAEANQADAYYCEIPNDPCVIVMFGASGDLARRKLLPALYDLAQHSCLAPRFRLVGFARTELSDDDFRRNASEFLPKNDSSGPSGVGQKDFLKDVLYVGRLKAKAPQVEPGELPERRRYRLEQTDIGFARAGLRRPHVGRPLLFAILHVDDWTRA